MKKIKQILCTLLAAVMLLGMTTVGVGAAPAFSDADQIVHVDAVNRAAELGYFVGSDGKFMPKDTVTRAQMATVIVKMLYSADHNADPYKNMGRFPDTADYQGGWADGYINLCARTGIVAGYDDGSFRPGRAVTTAEALTMILQAIKVSANSGSWPQNVISKAEEIGVFDGLAPRPRNDEPLNRDQLAFLLMAALDYKAEEDSRDNQSTPSSGGASGGSASGADPESGGQSGGTIVPPVVEEKPLGVEAGHADPDAVNLFFLSAQPARDGAEVEIKIELRGKVELCGFDLCLLYDTKSYTLKELNTDWDLQVIAFCEEEQGAVMFNYANATNIKKGKTILTATFVSEMELAEGTVFSLKPTEVIKVDAEDDYAVKTAEYTLTYCVPQL